MRAAEFYNVQLALRENQGLASIVNTEQDDSSDTLHWPRNARGVEQQTLPRDVGTTFRYRATSVQAAVRQSISKLRAVTDVPRLEAEVLMGFVLGVSRAALLAHPERPLSADEFWRYSEYVHHRASGYPLPYITSTAEFYGLTFNVTPEVLIPRPETEVLVDLARERNPASVIDVGTGSGCIAISLAVHMPATEIAALEISPAALAVAQRNVERHGVADRVKLMVGDILSPRPGPVDMIVSNPPYVLTSEVSALPASIRNYEPLVALDGGTDGLALIRQLLSQAPAVLRPGGCLLVEIGAGQGSSASSLARTVFPDAHIRVHPDLAGLDRVLEVQT